MAGTATPPLSAPETEQTLFTTVGDVRADGSLGVARLVVSNLVARRYEEREGQERMVVEYDMKVLTNPRIEDLVDAVALIADYRGIDVELIRTTSTKSLRIAG